MEQSKNTYWPRTLLQPVFVILIWSFLWFWPWQLWLPDFIWLRLGVALVIFIVPGLCIYGLMNNGQGQWTDHLTFGFVISHLLIASAGTIGRLVHVSFGLLRDFMMALGMVLLLLYLLPIASKGISVRINRTLIARVASVLPFILIGVLSGLITTQRILSDDDLTYLAYITNWQHSPRLDFDDLLFGTGQLVQPRFWLVSALFAQARPGNRGGFGRDGPSAARLSRGAALQRLL